MFTQHKTPCEHWIGVKPSDDDLIMITEAEMHRYLFIPYKFNFCPKCGEKHCGQIIKKKGKKVMDTSFEISKNVIEDLINGTATYITPDKKQESFVNKIIDKIRGKEDIYSARVHVNKLIIYKDRIEFSLDDKLICSLSFLCDVDFASGETVTVLLPSADFKFKIR